MCNRKYIIAGNWKMNGTLESLIEIAKVDQFSIAFSNEIALCIPATLIHKASEMLISNKLIIGAQDCHEEDKGAFTGDISAVMLKNVGAKIVIIGHSERRIGYGETNSLIKKKASLAIRNQLQTIICVGETQDDKIAGKTEEVVCSQLRNSIPKTSSNENTIIAYEPVWAIGTGMVPSLDEINHVHKRLRSLLEEIKGIDVSKKMRILYGGSVKPQNAKEIFDLEDVDGALVGGASLKSEDFINIAKQVNTI